MLERALHAAAEALGTLAWLGGLVVFVGASAHALAWLLARGRTARWVWNYWNLVGSALVGGGFLLIAYAWLVLGLHSVAGSGLAGLGLLVLSAGLWMLIPV